MVVNVCSDKMSKNDKVDTGINGYFIVIINSAKVT